MDAIAWWNRSKTEPIELAVFGMACVHCRDTVETVLRDLEGVRSVDVSLEKPGARVLADPAVSVHDLVQAIQAVGYEARPSPGT